MSQSFDVNFINPFIEGALHTLKVQCKVEARPGKLYKKSAAAAGYEIDIAGIIGITSPGFNGSISIAFPAATFLAIMGLMRDEKSASITPEVQDGAGEIVNIVFGFAKRVLNDKGFALEKALPSVVTGKGMNVLHVSSSPTVVVPFETDVGVFQIEITLEGKN